MSAEPCSGYTATFKVPERSDWSCRIWNDVTFTPTKGNEPNRFHRFMQRLAFGFKWERR